VLEWKDTFRVSDGSVLLLDGRVFEKAVEKEEAREDRGQIVAPRENAAETMPEEERMEIKAGWRRPMETEAEKNRMIAVRRLDVIKYNSFWIKNSNKQHHHTRTNREGRPPWWVPVPVTDTGYIMMIGISFISGGVWSISPLPNSGSWGGFKILSGPHAVPA
jgi:hypothetical protein